MVRFDSVAATDRSGVVPDDLRMGRETCGNVGSLFIRKNGKSVFSSGGDT